MLERNFRTELEDLGIIEFSSFIDQRQIQSAAFIFAHPDDVEGHSLGMLKTLLTKDEFDASNIHIVIGTNGAAGVKEVSQRIGITDLRKSEQKESFRQMGFSEEWIESNLIFMDAEDGDIDMESYQANMDAFFQANTPDMIVTHSRMPIGYPSSTNDSQKFDLVQNHPDHRKTSKIVQNAIKKVYRPKALLETTWDHAEARVFSTFDQGQKTDAFRPHTSQFQQNLPSIKIIEDRLNKYDETNARYEFFREVLLDEISTQDISLSEALMRHVGNLLVQGVRQTQEALGQDEEKVVVVDNYLKNLLISNSADLLHELIRFLRREKADVIRLGDDIDDELMQALDQALMFKVGLYVEGIDEVPREIRKVQVKVRNDEYFQFNFLW